MSLIYIVLNIFTGGDQVSMDDGSQMIQCYIISAYVLHYSFVLAIYDIMYFITSPRMFYSLLF